MRSRVAMVGCKEMPEGPWTLAKGNEVGLKVVHLMEGEYIRLVLVFDDSSKETIEYYDPGEYPFHSNGFSKESVLKKYQLSKHVNEGIDPSPTRVEVLLS